MALTEVLICLTLMAISSHASAGIVGHFEDYYDHHPNYHFEYSVHDPHTHDIKSQHETREGDVVKGYYSLKDADGTTREVHYTADHKNGFNAVVTKDGHQIHPVIEPHRSPVHALHI